MLCGHKTSIFLQSGGKLQIANHFALTHVSHSALRAALSEFCLYGDMIQRIQNVCKSLEKKMGESFLKDTLCFWVQTQRKHIQAILLKEERHFHMTEQKGKTALSKNTDAIPLTLIQLRRRLDPILVEIQYLDEFLQGKS
jgi:hypothetical protein